MTEFDIRGIEYDWFAVDAAGHVGMFSTAGGGLAPPAILHDEDYFDAALDARELLIAEPPTTTARRAPRIGRGLRNHWRLLAERGCYAFDSSIFGDDYRRVAAPTEPRLSDEFAPSLRTLFARVQLPGIRFDRQSWVAPSSWLGTQAPEFGTAAGSASSTTTSRRTLPSSACPYCGANDVGFKTPSPLRRMLLVLTTFFAGRTRPRIVGHCQRCGHSWRS